MNANPKADVEPEMSHGQFYKADELVELIYQDFGGFHPGARGRLSRLGGQAQWWLAGMSLRHAP